MSSPEGMDLYALSEAPTDVDGLKRYDFINWYCDEPAVLSQKRICASSRSISR